MVTTFDKPKICLKPDCGGELELIGEHPAVGCGGILYYKCPNPKCGTHYKDNQAGVLPLQAGLREVSKEQVEGEMEGTIPPF